MSNNPITPWLERLEPLMAQEVIQSHVRRQGSCPSGLDGMPPTEAAELIRQAFDDIFIPNEQHGQILTRLVGVMNAHYKNFYPDARSYIRLMEEGRAVDQFPPCICLTGLAGIGKSMLMRAMDQLLQPTTFRLNDQYPEVMHKPVRRIRINLQTGELDTLFTLASPDFIAGRTAIRKDALEKHLKTWLYAEGVALLVVDELQFVSLSATANTKVAKILLMLGYLGIPLLFISNFSMARRLMTRPQEERQRLLREPIVLWPDEHDSSEWAEMVEQYVCTAPGAFGADVSREASELWRLTGGIPRLLKELLVLAYALARSGGRGFASMKDVQSAFRSTAYFSQRADVEAMASLSVSSHRASRHADMVCPFEIRPVRRKKSTADSNVQTAFKRPVDHLQPSNLAVEHMLASTLHQEARAALKKQEKQESALEDLPLLSSVKLKVKALAPTVENLYAGAQALRDGKVLSPSELNPPPNEK